MNSLSRVSAVIPTKDVARVIRPTLESLRFCDEVIIVDMHSTDNTKQICLEYPNVRFIEREDYIYGNFNHGAEQAMSEWIIRLDSDEVIPPELRSSIQEIIAETSPQHSHYSAYTHLYLFGMRLHNGYGDQWRTVLFRKGTAKYTVQSEHEGLELTGEAGRLNGHYDHFSTPSLSAWMAKYNYYTDKDVERLNDYKPSSRFKIILNSLRYFRGAYFGKGRLRRDGYLGFVVAVMGTFGQVLLELKKWQIHEQQRLAKAGSLPDHPNAVPLNFDSRNAL